MVVLSFQNTPGSSKIYVTPENRKTASKVATIVNEDTNGEELVRQPQRNL